MDAQRGKLARTIRACVQQVKAALFDVSMQPFTNSIPTIHVTIDIVDDNNHRWSAMSSLGFLLRGYGFHPKQLTVNNGSSVTFEVAECETGRVRYIKGTFDDVSMTLALLDDKGGAAPLDRINFDDAAVVGTTCGVANTAAAAG